MKIIIKSGLELSPSELSQINATKAHQWQVPPVTNEDEAGDIYFLLKEGDLIIAQGELMEIKGVIFNNESFDIFGIGGIVSQEWGKGYGRQIMTAIKEYLEERKKSGVGFTNKPGFYEKCGFKVDPTSLKRFIYINDGEKITNETDDDVLYVDGKDMFMGKVLSLPTKEVLLPINPDW